MTWRELKAELEGIEEHELDKKVELYRTDGKARFAFEGPFFEQVNGRRIYFTVGMGEILPDHEMPKLV